MFGKASGMDWFGHYDTGHKAPSVHLLKRRPSLVDSGLEEMLPTNYDYDCQDGEARFWRLKVASIVGNTIPAQVERVAGGNASGTRPHVQDSTRLGSFHHLESERSFHFETPAYFYKRDTVD